MFSEIYGCYYNTVAAILSDAVRGKFTDRSISEAVQEYAFGESILSIPQAITQLDWPLIGKNGATPIKNVPTMPLTTLEKRWLKAILQDPRIRLFEPSSDGLDDVEPLFNPDTFIYFDRYSDGDPFQDQHYIENFKIILQALKDKRKVRVRFISRTGATQTWILVPYSIEYSSKDDKFRLISAGGNHNITVNMARIQSVTLLDECPPEAYHPVSYREKSLVFELTDERNALERVMLHFSHLEKETEKIDDSHYRVTLYYQLEDETELLIRILSFGPVIKVTAPEPFVKQIKQRLDMQKKFYKT